MSVTFDWDAAGPTADDFAVILAAVSQPSPALDDRDRIDRIAAMEQLKATFAAAQARETVAFKTSQLAKQKAVEVADRDLGRGIGAQVALARRESPFKGNRFVGLADALVAEMPHTLAAMTAGAVSEWRATLMARETACLSAEHRGMVDARLADSLATLSDGQVVRQARAHAYALDPHSFLARSQRAQNDRRVSLRPAPDTMAILTALLPVAQGVACLAALKQAAASGRAAGDPRGDGQLMADTLVERVTGQTTADHTPVEVQLLVTDTTLLGGGDEPARLDVYGPIPAPVARHLVRHLPDETNVWLRRLYVHPVTGRLTKTESQRRCFRGITRKMLIVRDETCRTPYCDSPIKHLDHVTPVAERKATNPHPGATTELNGQGLCEACNYTKTMPGWHSRPDPHGGAAASVQTTTPTGHTYTSTPPPLPGAPPDEAPPGSPEGHPASDAA